VILRGHFSHVDRGADIGNEVGQLDKSAGGSPARFSSNAVPYLLSTADAFVILLSSVAGGIGHQLSAGNAVPNVLPYCAVGLLASFIHILRMSGSGYYDFPDSAKPRVEIGEILICWFTTGCCSPSLRFCSRSASIIRAAPLWCFILLRRRDCLPSGRRPWRRPFRAGKRARCRAGDARRPAGNVHWPSVAIGKYR
jgi:hypothetical protein